MKIVPVSFCVSGPGRFPIDMLRYDGVVPSTETDAAKIERTFDGDGGPYKIKVHKPDGYKHWTPTSARWSTFGWTVTDIMEGS